MMKMRGRQLGQSMIEYTVVVGLGVMVLIAGGPGNSAIDRLWLRLQSHYTGYSYVVSLSDYPDANNPFDLNTLYVNQGLPDDLREYLEGDLGPLVSSLQNFTNGSLPNMQDALNMVTSVNVSPSSFLSGTIP